MASKATPGRINDDYAASGMGWAILLDGATALRPGENGCIHDVPWVVHNLAAHLSHALTVTRDVPLTDVLSGAISATCMSHAGTCDLGNPDSPSSTVTILRQRNDELDYLVLADSPLLLQCGNEIRVIVDDRMANLDDYSYEGVISVQNKPNGYYVASTLPHAAYESVNGSLPVVDVDAAALLSDGASRLADLFHTLTWQELFSVIREEGPMRLIERTRKIEFDEPEIHDGRTRKRHDDATAVFVTDLISD